MNPQTKMLNTEPEAGCIVGTQITTSRGLMELTSLKRRVGMYDDEDEHVDWVEYYFEGKVVHRSAHTTLKKFPSASGIAADLH